MDEDWQEAEFESASALQLEPSQPASVMSESLSESAVSESVASESEPPKKTGKKGACSR